MKVEYIEKYTVEELPDYDNEDVYDVEVDGDYTHNFFANDILVHNSLYTELGRFTNQLGLKGKESVDFIVKLWEEGLQPYINKGYDEYAKERGHYQNIHNLELEKIYMPLTLHAKKKYCGATVWKEPGVFFDNPFEHLGFTGLEAQQKSTAPLVRKILEDFYAWESKYIYDNAKLPEYHMIIEKVKTYKQWFYAGSIEDISKAFKISDYAKYVLDDKNQLVFGEHTAIHIKAAGVYNYILNNKPELKKKYTPLKNNDIVVFYYTSNPKMEVFGFKQGDIPLEIAPKLNYDVQFEKMVLTPLNKVVVDCFGMQPLVLNLTHRVTLF